MSSTIAKTNIEFIDKHHLLLADRMHTLVRAFRKQDFATSLRIARSLFKSLRDHCYEEERFMQMVSYEEFAEHQAEHQELISLLDRITVSLVNQDTDHWALASLLYKSFVTHVETHDLHYAKFYHLNK